MIQLRDNLAQLRANEQEIDHQVIPVQRALKLGGDTIVVSVQPFASGPERNEMSRAENVLSFVDADVVGLRHRRVGTACQIDAKRRVGGATLPIAPV
jgi:hypothetical protein